jgi:hypothetical protein
MQQPVVVHTSERRRRRRRRRSVNVFISFDGFN